MRYITHICTTEGLPSSDGIRKITFLTTDDSGYTFLGTDNNPLSEEVVGKMISEQKIVALPERFCYLKTSLYLLIKTVFFI